MDPTILFLCPRLLGHIFNENLNDQPYSGTLRLKLKLVCKRWFQGILELYVFLKFDGEKVERELRKGNETLPDCLRGQMVHKIIFMPGMSIEAANQLAKMMESLTSEVDSVVFMGWPLELIITYFLYDEKPLDGVEKLLMHNLDENPVILVKKNGKRCHGYLDGYEGVLTFPHLKMLQELNCTGGSCGVVDTSKLWHLKKLSMMFNHNVRRMIFPNSDDLEVYIQSVLSMLRAEGCQVPDTLREIEGAPTVPSDGRKLESMVLPQDLSREQFYKLRSCENIKKIVVSLAQYLVFLEGGFVFKNVTCLAFCENAFHPGQDVDLTDALRVFPSTEKIETNFICTTLSLPQSYTGNFTADPYLFDSRWAFGICEVMEVFGNKDCTMGFAKTEPREVKTIMKRGLNLCGPSQKREPI